MRHAALFVPTLGGGGAELIWVHLANGLASRDIRVDLVLANVTGPYLNQVDDAVRVIDLKASRVATSLGGLVRYLKGTRPQVLLSALSHANVVAILATRLARTGNAVIVSEHLANSAHNVRVRQLRERLLPRIMRVAYSHADRVVAVSHGAADDLAAMIGLRRSEINVVYNPVYSDALVRKAHEPVDHPWFDSEQPPVILAVGRLTPQKGFDVLLRAFALHRRTSRTPDRLLVLGDGPLRSELEALSVRLGVAESVQFAGFVANPLAYMRRSDLFVLSSRYEGLPGVLIEAMACGARVVSTDCPSGPREILENGRWGRLVPVEDAEALAQAIGDALADPHAPDVVRRAAQFGHDQAIDAYLALMRDLCIVEARP